MLQDMLHGGLDMLHDMLHGWPDMLHDMLHRSSPEDRDDDDD